MAWIEGNNPVDPNAPTPIDWNERATNIHVEPISTQR